MRAAPAHVFRTFTERMDTWWPRPYTMLKTPLKRVVLETHADGRLYHIGEDGSEINLGKVLVWEPPRRLLLAWQINAQWQYDPTFVTEVELTFTPQGADATQVILEHRNLEKYGAVAAGMGQGWSGLIALFAKAAAA